MNTEQMDKNIIIILVIVFILINFPPDLSYISSFKNIVLSFGYVLGGCILSAIAGVLISAIISMVISRALKRNLRNINTAKLILICSIVASLVLKIKRW